MTKSLRLLSVVGLSLFGLFGAQSFAGKASPFASATTAVTSSISSSSGKSFEIRPYLVFNNTYKYAVGVRKGEKASFDLKAKTFRIVFSFGFANSSFNPSLDHPWRLTETDSMSPEKLKAYFGSGNGLSLITRKAFPGTGSFARANRVAYKNLTIRPVAVPTDKTGFSLYADPYAVEISGTYLGEIKGKPSDYEWGISFFPSLRFVFSYDFSDVPLTSSVSSGGSGVSSSPEVPSSQTSSPDSLSRISGKWNFFPVSPSGVDLSSLPSVTPVDFSSGGKEFVSVQKASLNGKDSLRFVQASGAYYTVFANGAYQSSFEGMDFGSGIQSVSKAFNDWVRQYCVSDSANFVPSVTREDGKPIDSPVEMGMSAFKDFVKAKSDFLSLFSSSDSDGTPLSLDVTWFPSKPDDLKGKAGAGLTIDLRTGVAASGKGKQENIFLSILPDSAPVFHLSDWLISSSASHPLSPSDIKGLVTAWASDKEGHPVALESIDDSAYQDSKSIPGSYPVFFCYESLGLAHEGKAVVSVSD